MPRRAKKRQRRVVVDTSTLVAGISGFKDTYTPGRNQSADVLHKWVSVVSQLEIRVSTQTGPDVSAQSVGQVARLSGNVRQPKSVLANAIAGHKAERRPGAGEEWRAGTKHDGAKVESILINKAKVG